MQTFSLCHSTRQRVVILNYQTTGKYFFFNHLENLSTKFIYVNNSRCVAERNNSHYSQGYVFSQRHLQLGEKLVLQILQTDELFAGSLAFGLTTCDPSKLNSINLPEDPHQLLDRPEYWVVIKDVANAPQAGDELAFKINQTGEVQMIKNRQLPITLMHVDQTQKLWPFFDLYGSTIKVKVLGKRFDF